MACAPNTPVRWSDVYAISSRIDALAETLSTPSYTKLEDEPAMPFKFPSLVNFAGAIRFEVNLTPGVVLVAQQHLSDGIMQIGEHVLDAVLDAMGANNDLFLVVEEDDCWCKTIFKIDTTSGVPRVKEVPQLGCCQSLFVPQPGDPLDYGQHVIPAGHVAHFAATGNPEEGTLWQLRHACVAETAGCGYKFQTTVAESPLTDCTREILSAKFTWPIRAAHFSKMIEKLQYILACANSGGAVEDAIQTPDPFNPYIGRGCEVHLCDLVRDRVERSLMNYTTPGCVSTGCSDLDVLEPTIYPWDSPTCSGEECDGEGPKVYCRTLQDLEAILAIAEVGLRPYNPPTGVCRPCVCSWDLECEQRVGTAESCYVYAGPGGEALIGYRDETYFDPPPCVNFYQYAYIDGIVQSCNGTETNTPCGHVLVGSEETCSEGDVVGNYTIPIFGPLPSWSAVKSAAEAAYDACALEPGGCGAWAETYFALNNHGPIFGASSAWASKASMRIRFRMSGTWSCSGTQSSTRNVRYKRTEVTEGVTTETEVTVVASWSSGEQTYVTEWIEEAAPAFPTAIPGSNQVTYSLVSAENTCPEDCDPI
jgi:hypothetical protein